MGHIPNDLQTSLSGRSKEHYFVGCSELHHGAVKLFNPLTKRVTLRHSFKYLSDVEQTSTTFLIPEDQSPNSDLTFDSSTSTDSPDDTSPLDEDEFTFTPISKAKALAKYKFAYSFLNNSFLDKSNNTTYIIHDIVRLSTLHVANVYCFQYYSASDFPSPPSSNSDYEYEPIDEFLQDPNYSLPRNIPTRSSAKSVEFIC
jgi:hypothetical protein